MTRNAPAAVLTGVTRSFPPVVALRDVSLTVDRGDYISIMGPSGSGKSTLLNILGLLDRPTGGEYELDGISTTGLSEKQRAVVRGTRIGFVFQAFHLLPNLTTVTNVMLGMGYSGIPRAGRRALADQALMRIGIGHRAQYYPRTLSGGERQRVAIARAMVGEPEILLADEPTGNLDESSAADIMEVFDSLNEQGLTIIVVTHNIMVADCAHKRLVMRDGRLELRR